MTFKNTSLPPKLFIIFSDPIFGIASQKQFEDVKKTLSVIKMH